MVDVFAVMGRCEHHCTEPSDQDLLFLPHYPYYSPFTVVSLNSSNQKDFL